MALQDVFYIGVHINHRTWGLRHLLPSHYGRPSSQVSEAPRRFPPAARRLRCRAGAHQQPLPDSAVLGGARRSHGPVCCGVRVQVQVITVIPAFTM